MPRISVIVPVYKVESYIYRCVESILEQTFVDFELLLIDDGSPDNCGKICDEFAERDKRVKSFHKMNGGLSDARNYGFQHAEGEYVIFIDSDDYIEKDMLEYLYNNINRYQADMATCGAYDVFENKVERKQEVEEFVCSGEEAFGYILKGIYVRGEIWNKLIKSSLIRTLQFPKGKLYEDIFFTANMMKGIKCVCIGTKPKYYYVHRSDSITGQPYRPQLQDIIEAYEMNYEIVEESFPNLLEIAECLKIWSRFIVLDKILLEDNYKQYQEYKLFRKYLCKSLRTVWKNKYFHPYRKISLLILSFSVSLYRRLVFISVRKQIKVEG